jgi:predicted alpha-1,2-mannosidase
MKHFLLYAAAFLLVTAACRQPEGKEPVDYVNPAMGGISHMLVPTFPTVHLPNSMMRVFPVRGDYTGNRLKGLPLIVTNHRSASSLNVVPFQGNEEDISAGMTLSYDRETIRPYQYSVYLDEAQIEVEYAPSHRSAVYRFAFEKNGTPYLVIQSRGASFNCTDNAIQGSQPLSRRDADIQARVFFYILTDVPPVKITEGSGSFLTVQFPENTRKIGFRYGISFISEAQAKANLEREIQGYDVETVARAGRRIWNETLGKISIRGGTEDEKSVFYTSLYRVFERPVNLSEDGRYFSGFDGKIHDDGGRAFYTDDWIWDTYRAAHPLRVLIDKEAENDIIRSYLLMAEQAGTNWIPTFPGVTGDARSMNCTHSVAMVIDAYRKGLRGFELEKAYQACKQALEERSLIPWSNVAAGELDAFYKEKGYFPALKPDEAETVPGVHSWEKRQPVAVTLGTSYDHWCLSLIARELDRTEEADYYLGCSYNYRNLFHPQTGFFHPKDRDGNFIEPFDYRISGGPGARDYYDENNGYIYRWDVQHNIAGLIALTGGNEPFVRALEEMYDTPYGMPRWEFYNTLPDHTGNVGMFSMANEPCLHIPYLYNYAGQPWRTQKRIRNLLEQWFRNDLMGVPGDEDGGGMSAFVVFSQMGFYPVTPGSPTYNIGSPVFSYVKIDMGNGAYFEIKAPNASNGNRYIQSARLNGQPLDQPWFNHEDIAGGGLLELEMGPKANKTWGVSAPPPSAAPTDTTVQAQRLDIQQAEKIFSLPVHCIETEFPNKMGQVVGSVDDLKRPRELRPIFYGCFDWHSSVHGYWSVIKLMKDFPELDKDGKVRALLNQTITEANVATEKAFFEEPNNLSFERTYGWAWFLQLQNELYTWQDEDARRWYRTLQPLADLLVEKYTAYLPKLFYPIRTGQHDNSAFGLSLSIDYARTVGNRAFEQVITEHAQRLFRNDENGNLAFEPGGNDFLSPCLEEALLMSKVWDTDTYQSWLKRFLPPLFDAAFHLEPGKVSDRTDGHLVHLDGLNFSRATCLYGIGRKLPGLHHLRKTADLHLDYSIRNITDDDYMGSHWLGSFALYALTSKSMYWH